MPTTAATRATERPVSPDECLDHGLHAGCVRQRRKFRTLNLMDGFTRYACASSGHLIAGAARGAGCWRLKTRGRQSGR